MWPVTEALAWRDQAVLLELIHAVESRTFDHCTEHFAVTLLQPQPRPLRLRPLSPMRMRYLGDDEDDEYLQLRTSSLDRQLN